MDFDQYSSNQGVPFMGSPVYPQPDNEHINAALQRSQTKGLRSLSVTAGFCVLGFIGLQFFVYYLLGVFGLADDFQNNLLFQNAFGAVYSVLCVFLPFLLVAIFMSKETRNETLLFGKPYSKGLMLLAVPCGFMFCMFGNYATNALISLMKSIGVTLTSPDMPAPTSAVGMMMFVVQIAFIPALIEEFALRGVIMQPLRKYGDRFAIIMSALVFALMHGNMVQAPFAFIAGIAIGYYVIATGSIWTGVLIHFANNLFSSLFSLVSSTGAAVETPYAAVMTAAFVIGIACCLIFALNENRYKLRKPEFQISAGKRFAAYIFTVPMLAALAAIIYITMDYVQFGG